VVTHCHKGLPLLPGVSVANTALFQKCPSRHHAEFTMWPEFAFSTRTCVAVYSRDVAASRITSSVQ
jgi:hypothetical protein